MRKQKLNMKLVEWSARRKEKQENEKGAKRTNVGLKKLDYIGNGMMNVK